MTDLVARAREFAFREHRRIDHRRKYSKQPYDVHLEAVADLVAGVTDDPEMIAAAWLHDMSRTRRSRSTTSRGSSAARWRGWSTSSPTSAGRATATAPPARRSTARTSPPRAKTIKLADLTDNAPGICRHDARNHLAHSQAIVAHHWHQIAGLSRRLDDWMLENAGLIVELPR